MSLPVSLMRWGNPRILGFIGWVVVALVALGLAIGHWASGIGHVAPVRTPHVQALATGADVTLVPQECRPVVGYTC